MRPHSLSSRRSPARVRGAALASALALGFASAANAVSISSLSVTLDPGNTADLFDDTAPVYREIQSDVAVLPGSTATSFTTRYQGGVYTDATGSGSVNTTIILNAAYTISFDVTDAVGSAWRLDLATSRVGARTAVGDGGGQSAFSLGAVTGLFGGAGSLSSGSLDLAAIASSNPNGDANLTFNQNGTASITGTGNGTVTLSFTFTATAETLVNGNNGDEAAVRLGIPTSLPADYTAGAYPGVGGRNAANDGHFVDLDLIDLGPIPEPDTALLLGMGLGILAVQGRRRRPR